MSSATFFCVSLISIHVSPVRKNFSSFRAWLLFSVFWTSLCCSHQHSILHYLNPNYVSREINMQDLPESVLHHLQQPHWTYRTWASINYGGTMKWRNELAFPSDWFQLFYASAINFSETFTYFSIRFFSSSNAFSEWSETHLLTAFDAVFVSLRPQWVTGE